MNYSSGLALLLKRGRSCCSLPTKGLATGSGKSISACHLHSFGRKRVNHGLFVTSAQPFSSWSTTSGNLNVLPSYDTSNQTRLRKQTCNDLKQRHFSIAASHLQDSVGGTITPNSAATVVTPFLLADIGEGIAEVELLKWYVKPGDTVQQFDVVCQVQSDKATVDISSRYDGMVTELAGQVGEMIKVGTPLLFLAQQGTTNHPTDNNNNNAEPNTAKQQPDLNGSSLNTPPLPQFTDVRDAATDSDSDEESSVVTNSANSADTYGNDPVVQMSPAVRKLCKEQGINPRSIPCTGPQGRLLKMDVLKYLESRMTNNTPSAVTETGSATANTTSIPTIQQPSTADAAAGEIIKLKGYTRVMAKTMTQSLQIPHMCLSDELNVTALLKIRQQINQQSSSTTATTTKISLLAFICKACSMALQEFPTVNAAAHSDAEIRLNPHHHIGVAVDTPRGLVVPAIPFVEQLSILEIQEQLDAFKADRGENLKLDLVPTFTISNIGALGAGLSLQPVLVPPQLAMGAIGRLQRLPRFASTADEENVVIAVDLLPVTWAADHRFLDGATLARFHVKVQSLLHDPWQMMIHLK